MKAPVDKAATARVLADIADAVRPVDMARTAAAVERVLATASPGHGPFPCSEASRLAYDLCEDLDALPVTTNCIDHCPGADLDVCESDGTWEDHATPGMTIGEGHGPEYLARCMAQQRRDYRPWVVSPHLFEAVDQ